MYIGIGKVVGGKTRCHCHSGHNVSLYPLIFGSWGRRKVKLNRYLPVLRRELHRTGGEALPTGTASLPGVCSSEKVKKKQSDTGQKQFFLRGGSLHVKKHTQEAFVA